MIKNCIFDVDGTLVDSEKAFYTSLRYTINQMDLKYTDDELSGLFGCSVNQVIQKLNIENTTEFTHIWEKQFNTDCKAIGFFNGIVSTFARLKEKNISVIILTSRSHATVDYLCEDSLISDFIDGCIAAEDTEKHKPDPEPLLKAINDYHFKPEETVYIGDTESDLKCANAANIRFVFAAWNNSADKLDDNFCIETPKDILKYCG